MEVDGNYIIFGVFVLIFLYFVHWIWETEQNDRTINLELKNTLNQLFKKTKPYTQAEKQ